MVDIVCGTDIVYKTEHIVYGSKYIVVSDVLGAKLGDARLYLGFYSVHIAAALLHDGEQHGRAHLFANAAVMQIVADQLFGPAGIV